MRVNRPKVLNALNARTWADLRTAFKDARDDDAVRGVRRVVCWRWRRSTTARAQRGGQIGGVTLQIVRDWVLRFNALGPEGLVDRKAPGQPALLDDEQRAALVHIVEEGPTPAIHGVVRWRIIDLCQWLFETFRICVSETTVSRELRKLGYRKLSARPRHHAQARGRDRGF